MTWLLSPGRHPAVWLRLALALLFIYTLCPPPTTAAQGLPRPRYAIELQLDVDAGRAGVHQTVTYANTTGANLTSVVFHITAAYYGAFALAASTVDGQPVAARLDGIVLEVPLPNGLAPGATATVAFDYSLTLPRPGNLRFGLNQGVIALGNWYPVLSVYREGPLTYGGRVAAGWDRHQHNTPAQAANGVEPGDAFFTEVADYDVKLTLSRALTVAHTGDLQEGSTATELRYAARGVRDFALAMSARYETARAQVGGTTVLAYYLPEHRAGGQQYLQSAQGLLAWANQTLGTYPYGTYFVAETSSADPSWVGQEYPGVSFISSQTTAGGGGLGSYLDYLVVHETVHQWFYALVGDDQLYEPWVDEALTTHVSYRYWEAVDPALGRSTWQTLAERRRQEAAIYADRPVNTSIYDYADESHYFAIVYRKGAAFLEEARQSMGDAAYLAALRVYADRYRGGIATGRDLLMALESGSGPGFPALVARFFDYPDFRAPPPSTPTPTPAASPTASAGPIATIVGIGLSTVTATVRPMLTPGSTPLAATPTLTATPPPAPTPTSSPALTPTSALVPTSTSAPEPTATATEPSPTATPAASPADWPEVGGWLVAGAGVLILGLVLALRRARGA